MGSQSSKSKKHEDTAKYGQIYLKTDRQAYFGGETISGEIYLNLVSQYPGNKLILRIKGKENAHVLQFENRYIGTPNTPYIGVYAHHHQAKKLLDRAVTVHEWPSMMPGQYVIPFTCQLPQDLPSSFHQGGHMYLANVSYRLEAFLEPTDPKTHGKLKFKQNIIVKKPLAHIDQQLSKQITTHITKLKFIDKGSNVLKVDLENNCFYPGDVVKAKIYFDNSQCKSSNTEITFSLKQELKLDIPQAKLKKDFIITSNTIPGVKKKTTSGVHSVQIQLPPLRGDIDYNEAKGKTMESYLHTLKDDNSVMHSTTETGLISSKYFLEVSCPMKGVGTSTPKLVFPIEICTPGVHVQPVSAPEDWNPVHMKASVL